MDKLDKMVILTSIHVVRRKNDWKNNYVSKLAQNNLVGSQIYAKN